TRIFRAHRKGLPEQTLGLDDIVTGECDASPHDLYARVIVTDEPRKRSLCLRQAAKPEQDLGASRQICRIVADNCFGGVEHLESPLYPSGCSQCLREAQCHRFERRTKLE